MSHALLYVAASLDEAPVPEEVKIQSADVEHFVQETFTINDARALFLRAHRKAVTQPSRFFLIFGVTFTVESQNALLKLFEEPPEGVVFHVVVPREEVLIPTLRSRFSLVAIQKEKRDTSVFETFLTLNFKDRLACVQQETKEKNNEWIQELMYGSELYAEECLKNGNAEIGNRVSFIQNAINTRGASAKMLLEELALSLPSSA